MKPTLIDFQGIKAAIKWIDLDDYDAGKCWHLWEHRRHLAILDLLECHPPQAAAYIKEKTYFDPFFLKDPEGQCNCCRPIPELGNLLGVDMTYLHRIPNFDSNQDPQ